MDLTKEENGMKKSFVKVLSMALAVTALAACSKEQIKETPAGEESNSPKTISAVIGEEGVKTTIAVGDASAKVLWSQGDQISVSSEGVTDIYALDGDGGESSGNFYYVSGETLPAGKLVAYFPQTITPANMVWPSDQTYKAEVGAPMIATIEEYKGGAVDGLTFTNLGAILRLNLTTSKENIKVATITVAAEQPLSGAFTLNEGAAVVSEGNGKVTLNCGEGVEIGTFDSFFNLAVPANKADEYYTNVVVTVVTTDGLTCDKHVAKLSTSLERNCVYNIAMPMNDFAKYEGPVSANMAHNSVAIKWQNPDAVKALDEITYEALVYWDGMKDVSGDDGRIQTLMGCEGGYLLRNFTSLSSWEQSSTSEPPAGWRVARPGNAGNLTFGKKNDDGSFQNLTPGTWHHVCYTHKSGADCVYIDGILVASDNKATAKADLTTGPSDKPQVCGFHIGLSYEDKRWFGGKMAEVRVWKRALEASELTYAHRLSIDPATATGLIGYWKFDEGEGQYLQDYSGNGNYGTFAKAASWNGTGVGPYAPDTISLDPESLTLASAGETKDVTVTCSPAAYAVEIPAEATWLTYTTEGSVAHITAAANAGGERTATVTFKAGFATTTLTVTQNAAVTPVTLLSGPTDVILAAKSDTEVSGATIEWTLNDNNQEWEAVMTPASGATLTPDVANHKLTLTVPETAYAQKINHWSIVINKKNVDGLTPVVINVLQQCYNRHVKKESSGFYAYMQKNVSISEGSYHFLNFGGGWRYCHPSFVQGQVKCFYNAFVDTRMDYAGNVYNQGLDGDNGIIKQVCADMMIDIAPAGDGQYTMRPYKSKELGLGVDGSGTFKVGYEFRNYKWTIKWESYGWVFKGENGYYLQAADGKNTTNNEVVITASTSKQSPTSGRHIRLYAVDDPTVEHIKLSISEASVKKIGDSFEVTVDCLPAEFTITNPASGWLTATPDGNKVTFEKTAEPATYGDYTITFTAGSKTADLKVTALDPSTLLFPDMSNSFFKVTWPDNLKNQSTLTFEFWMKTAGNPSGYANESIIGIEGTFLIRIEGNGTDPNTRKYHVAGLNNTKTDVELNTWTHIAVVSTGGTTTLYKNGTRIGSGSKSVPSDLNGSSSGSGALKTYFYIGNAYDGLRNIRGTIAYVRMWKTARTAQQILSDMTDLEIEDSNIIADWRFNDGMGNTVKDYSGNNLNIKALKMSGSSVVDGTITWKDYGSPFTKDE